MVKWEQEHHLRSLRRRPHHRDGTERTFFVRNDFRRLSVAMCEGNAGMLRTGMQRLA